MRREPRGRWGVWLYARQRDRGLTQSEAFEELRGLFGWGPTSRASYSKWLYGTSEPNDDEQAILLRHFRADPPPDHTESAAEATPAALSDLIALQRQLVEAFEVQAQAVMALVDEMRLSREAEVEDLLARMRALEVTVRTLHSPAEVEASEEPPARRATAG